MKNSEEEAMTGLLEYITKQPFILCIASIGDALLIVGIVTAAIGATIAAFTPVVWILLAIAFYVCTICLLLMRFAARQENKPEH